MNSLNLSGYLDQAGRILGYDVLSIEAGVILFLATVVATQMIYMVANSLSNGNAEYLRSLVLCAITLLLAPLALSVLEAGLARLEVGLGFGWLTLLSLLLPGLLVTSFLTARSFRCSFLCGALSVLPAMVFWFLLIILLHQVEESLDSGGEKAESILGRTQELDQILNE